MKHTGKKLMALGLTAALAVSALSVSSYVPGNTTVEAASRRVGDEGCLEVPGTVSTFDDYNESFLSVPGYAQKGVHDRSADLGTSRHRVVSNAKEFLQAVRDAKRNTGTADEVSEPAVTIIEVTKDIELGKLVDGYSDVQSRLNLNTGYTVTQKDFPGVCEVTLSDIDGLTIFSKNGSALKHCDLQVGVGGTNAKGVNDVIIRNLKFDGCWQWDNTGHQKESGWAYMKIYMSTNVWVDHCSFTVACDGNVDIESGANGITLSWCKFGLSAEEAKQSDSVVYSSVMFMEDWYQESIDYIGECKAAYETQTANMKAAGYDSSFISKVESGDSASVAQIKEENAKLYSTFISAYSKYIKSKTLNSGTMYADMRMAGATPEDIMAYAAYHSKVHLTGSGDREIKDYVNSDGKVFLDSNDRLELTLAYNWYQNVGQRVPMIRKGRGHLMNCYIDDSDHKAALSNSAVKKYARYTLSRCINARDGASIAADTCVFNEVDQPLIGQEKQGNDIGNMNSPYDSLYRDAYNYALIVNSKMTNSSGDIYKGSSWDNDGKNSFTGYSKDSSGNERWNNYKYDETLKKWSWKSTIVSLGSIPLADVDREALYMSTDSYLTPHLDANGAIEKNANGNPVYDAFVWSYDTEATLPYSYQLIALDDVKDVVTSHAGAGAVSFDNGDEWVKTAYTKGGEPEESETPDPSTQPAVSASPAVSSEPAVESEAPVVSKAPEVSENPVVSSAPSEAVVESPVPSPEVKESAEPSQTPDASPVPITVKVGDVDGNGTVELKDAQMALKMALKLMNNSTFEQVKAADVDGNGTVELKDAQMILKVALKLASFDDQSSAKVQQFFKTADAVMRMAQSR